MIDVRSRLLRTATALALCGGCVALPTNSALATLLLDDGAEALAASGGQAADQFLATLEALLASRPDQAPALLSLARRVRPDLSAAIEALALGAGPGDAQLAQATVPTTPSAASGAASSTTTAAGLGVGTGMGAGTVAIGVGIAAAAGAALALGSGSSGGDDGPATPTPAPPPAPPPPPPPPPPPDPDPDPDPDPQDPDDPEPQDPDDPDDPTDPDDPGDVPADFETQEYGAMGGLAAVNASAAYARGLTGQGIIVGVLDGGVQADHPNLADAILGCFNAGTETAGCDQTVDDDHGTHVAGLIAGLKNDSGMHGVAFNAQLVAIDIFDGEDFTVDDANIAAGFDYARAQGVRIYNNSWGSDGEHDAGQANLYGPGTALYDAFLAVLDDGGLIVFANGNDGYDGMIEPSVEAALPRYHPALESGWIAVAAVGETGAITEYSQRCGEAAAWCISAPGGGDDQEEHGLYSSATDSGYVRLSGTSMATPMVSGGLALLMEMAGDQMSAQQIRDRLFATADKDGLYADTAVYGQGLMNLDRATAPVGAQQLALADRLGGPRVGLRDSALRLGPAFGDSLSLALAGQEVMVLDSLDFPFRAPLGGLTSVADARLDSLSLLGRFDRRSDLPTVALGHGGTLQAGFRTTGSPHLQGLAGHQERRRELAVLDFRQELGGGTAVSASLNRSPALAFGLHAQGVVEESRVLSRDAFANPLLSFAERGHAVGLTTAVAGGSLRLAAFDGRSARIDQLHAHGVAAEFSLPLAVTESRLGGLSLMGGTVLERQTVLGSRAAGAFDLADGTPTTFVGVSGHVDLAATLRLAGSLHLGWSNPTPAANSMIRSLTTVETDAFALGLIGEALFDARDSFGLTLSQPLRVRGGRADLSVPDRRTPDGQVLRQTVSAGLAPSGREIALEAFYGFDLTETSRLAGSLMLRQQPGHVRTAPNEGIAMLRYQLRF